MIAPPTPQAIGVAHKRGHAICSGCGLIHAEAGRQHLISPWRITPCCAECGGKLRMPDQPARDQRIRDLWASDLTLTQIGMEVGASSFTVHRSGRRMGLPPRLRTQMRA